MKNNINEGIHQLSSKKGVLEGKKQSLRKKIEGLKKENCVLTNFETLIMMFC